MAATLHFAPELLARAQRVKVRVGGVHAVESADLKVLKHPRSGAKHNEAKPEGPTREQEGDA